MEFKIDISINLLKHSNFTAIEEDVVYFAKQYNCKDINTSSETEGRLKNSVCKYIISISFPACRIDDFIQFIKHVKKIKNIHIETVYTDDNLTTVLYASPVYLQTLHKNIADNYKKNKKQRIYSEDEKKILLEL